MVFLALDLSANSLLAEAQLFAARWISVEDSSSFVKVDSESTQKLQLELGSIEKLDSTPESNLLELDAVNSDLKCQSMSDLCSDNKQDLSEDQGSLEDTENDLKLVLCQINSELLSIKVRTDFGVNTYTVAVKLNDLVSDLSLILPFLKQEPFSP